MKFQLQSPFTPTGDQPYAIDQLTKGVQQNIKQQTLLGVTGSGKTFTMANVIANTQRPTLIISHNKTLAAQLANEFRLFFPNNAVHYFVSYYDYYQPEAYIASSGVYIEKEADINEEIDRLRHAATQSLLTRKDVIVVASVSCIYGIGSPESYLQYAITLQQGATEKRKSILERLVRIQFTRNDYEFRRGTFRVKGDLLEIHPAHTDEIVQLDMFGDEIEKINIINEVTGEILQENISSVTIFPATHFVTPQDTIQRALQEIRKDLKLQLAYFKKQGKLVEEQRLRERVNYDMEMIEQTGTVSGIENYSRYFDGRKPGKPSSVLLDFFPDDFLMFIDESHMTLPQIRGMIKGDQARKKSLIDNGFRLPAAYDNRPLCFEEFNAHIHEVIYVSATPQSYELQQSTGHVAEQLIRPTGLLDPTINIRPTTHQIDNILNEVQQRIKKHQRVLITTLTKRMAEDLAEYLVEASVKALFLHSEQDTFERLEVLKKLRKGNIDVVVGVNLLREGLDLPEVSLICILDADKEGFLRNKTSFVQTIGRAARHMEGHVIMYADKITGSMKEAIQETARRRSVQEAYNTKHGISPQTIKKDIYEAYTSKKEHTQELELQDDMPREEKIRITNELQHQMELASENLEFEKAIELRDQIAILKKSMKKH